MVRLQESVRITARYPLVARCSLLLFFVFSPEHPLPIDDEASLKDHSDLYILDLSKRNFLFSLHQNEKNDPKKNDEYFFLLKISLVTSKTSELSCSNQVTCPKIRIV